MNAMSDKRRYWLRILAANVAASIMAVTMFTGVTMRSPFRSVLVAFGVAFVFSSSIAPIAGFVLPRLGRWVWTHLDFPWNWGILVVAMIGIGAVGSVLALGVLIVIGYLPPRLFFDWLAGSLKISIVVTLTIGLAVTMYEVMRTKLEEATLALRTKERDEAEARRLATEAQLSSLESRVNPHFLFNTLNSIASLTHDDPAGAERMTGQLASLMRASLDAGSSPLVPLEQELRGVRDYLEIERVRFGDRLRFRFETNDGTLRALVPRLSLQTVVENSVKFAVAPSREGAMIVVRAGSSDGRLTLTIEDDGPGFAGLPIVEGHGLALLEQRLAMLFGDRASLHVVSRERGTSVVIEVPFQ